MIKIGIVGCGLVGSTAAYALIMRGIGRKIVLVSKTEARAQAVEALSPDDGYDFYSHKCTFRLVQIPQRFPPSSVRNGWSGPAI